MHKCTGNFKYLKHNSLIIDMSNKTEKENGNRIQVVLDLCPQLSPECLLLSEAVVM